MYQLVRAYGVLRDSDGLHQQAPIESMNLSVVFAQYSTIYAVVTTDNDPTEKAMDLYALPYQISWLGITLQSWFASIGTATLPTFPVPAETKQVYVQHWNLHLHNFDARLANRNFHPSVALESDQEIDVLVSKDNANYEQIAKHCLLSVNGLLHRVDYNNYGIWGLGAGTSRRHSGLSELGLLDFQHLGQIQTLPIATSQLFKRHEEIPYSTSVYLKLNESIGQRQPLLVLGGYLLLPGTHFKVVADNVIRVDFKDYPWFERFVVGSKLVDYSSLGVQTLPNQAYSRKSLFSDLTIERLFTLEQSFVVLVDTPKLEIGVIELEATQLPNRYYSSVLPWWPVITGDGRIAEAHIANERHKWVVSIASGLQDNVWDFHYLWEDDVGIAYRRNPADPIRYTNAKFLVLSKLLEPSI